MVFLTGRVYHKTLVLDMIRGAFPGLLCLLGGKDPPFCFFLSPFIVISFFLNRVPRVGTCPISLSLQLLGVVVRTEKYGFARHKALNAVVAAFPLDVFIFSVVFSCPTERYGVSPLVICWLFYPRLYPSEKDSPWPRRYFSLAGPPAQCRQRYGPISFLPTTIVP